MADMHDEVIAGVDVLDEGERDAASDAAEVDDGPLLVADFSWAEPWKIKMVEPLKMLTREERSGAIEPRPAGTPSCCAPRTSTSTC
jgi:hypothetical protein